MPDTKHLKWLLKGVDSWNRCRKATAFSPNLEGADINAEFGGFDDTSKSQIPLEGINLSESNLRGANLSYANLKGADLTDSDLSGANLTSCTIANADMSGAILEGARIYCSSLTNTDWTCTDPWNAVLFRPLTPEEQQKKKVAKKRDVPTAVEGVASLVTVCSSISQHYREHPVRTTLYFRGERDATWELQPTIMRESSHHLRPMEGRMLVDLMSRQPEIFDTESSAFSQLVLARHHGLRTRLLDVTRNPLVALFTACGGFSDRPSGSPSEAADTQEEEKRQKDADKKKEKEQDGCIHVFAVRREMIKPFNSDTISIVCNFAKLEFEEKLVLLGDTSAKLSGSPNYRRSLRRLYHFIRQEKPNFEERINPVDFFKVFVAEPQQRFARVQAQAGAFLVSALHERLEQTEVQGVNCGIPIYDHYSLDVPRDKWAEILEELDMLNIRRETLLPSLDESAKAVVQAYS